MSAIIKDLLASEMRQIGSADMILQAAEWAAAGFARFDRAQVGIIAQAAADAAFARAGDLAEAAVRETGFGVAADKKIKNEIASRGIYERYKADDYCSKRIRAEDKIVELPRPAGVVFALTPSTNPVCTVFFKVMLALLTRNAIIISPHPMAKKCSVDAARAMSEGAERAGAPSGIIQVVEEPKLSLIDHFMKSPRVNVILATGGKPMVRSAYSSGNPAIGVGPGNAPVMVDASADLAAAAKRIVQSKSFDNSVLCTNESVVVAEQSISDQLLTALGRAGAHVADPAEVALLRDYLFGMNTFNADAIGKSATDIAQRSGLRMPSSTRVIVVEIDRVGIDEPLSREKLCPVVGFLRVPNVKAAFAASRALIRMSGAGHSAAIHSRTPANILAFGQAVKALRVVVNAPCAQGAAGFATCLAPTFTAGTGFYGGSSIGENLEPRHLVNWTRIAYSDEAGEPFGDFGGLETWASGGAIAVGRNAPMSLGTMQEGALPAGTPDDMVQLREEIRHIVLEELRSVLKD